MTQKNKNTKKKKKKVHQESSMQTFEQKMGKQAGCCNWKQTLFFVGGPELKQATL